jgi:hypothetical protein
MRTHITGTTAVSEVSTESHRVVSRGAMVAHPHSSRRQKPTTPRITSRRASNPQLPKMPVSAVVDIEPDAAMCVRAALEIVDD